MHLALLVVAQPSRLPRAIEEVGDCIYPHDPTVVVEECGESRACAWTSIEPWRALLALAVGSPAYAERVAVVVAVESTLEELLSRLTLLAAKLVGCCSGRIRGEPRGYRRIVTSTISSSGGALRGGECVVEVHRVYGFYAATIAPRGLDRLRVLRRMGPRGFREAALLAKCCCG